MVVRIAITIQMRVADAAVNRAVKMRYSMISLMLFFLPLLFSKESHQVTQSTGEHTLRVFLSVNDARGFVSCISNALCHGTV